MDGWQQVVKCAGFGSVTLGVLQWWRTRGTVRLPSYAHEVFPPHVRARMLAEMQTDRLAKIAGGAFRGALACGAAGAAFATASTLWLVGSGVQDWRESAVGGAGTGFALGLLSVRNVPRAAPFGTRVVRRLAPAALGLTVGLAIGAPIGALQDKARAAADPAEHPELFRARAELEAILRTSLAADAVTAKKVSTSDILEPEWKRAAAARRAARKAEEERAAQDAHGEEAGQAHGDATQDAPDSTAPSSPPPPASWLSSLFGKKDGDTTPAHGSAPAPALSASAATAAANNDDEDDDDDVDLAGLVIKSLEDSLRASKALQGGGAGAVDDDRPASRWGRIKARVGGWFGGRGRGAEGGEQGKESEG